MINSNFVLQFDILIVSVYITQLQPVAGKTIVCTTVTSSYDTQHHCTSQVHHCGSNKDTKERAAFNGAHPYPYLSMLEAHTEAHFPQHNGTHPFFVCVHRCVGLTVN